MLTLKELGLHFADSQSVSLVRKFKKEALVDGFFTRNESPANEMREDAIGHARRMQHEFTIVLQ